MELEIKFQNEAIEDLERQILNIVRKYAELKCKHEKHKKRQNTIRNRKYRPSEKEIDSFENIENEQLVNAIEIKANDFDKYY